MKYNTKQTYKIDKAINKQQPTDRLFELTRPSIIDAFQAPSI